MVLGEECNPENPTQLWDWDFVDNSDTVVTFSTVSLPKLYMDAYECQSGDGNPVFLYPDDNGQGTCQGQNQRWVLNADSTIVNNFTRKCLDVYDYTGPVVDTWDCNGGSNQVFFLNKTKGIPNQGAISSTASNLGPSRCLTAAIQDCTNVWGRVLSNGSYALAFVNNGPDAVLITCDATCFSQLNISVSSFVVRDLWAHENVGVISPPFTWQALVNGNATAAIFKLTPM